MDYRSFQDMRREMGGFEAFWADQKEFSFRQFNSFLKSQNISCLSSLVPPEKAEQAYKDVQEILESKGLQAKFLSFGSVNFPAGLMDSIDPIRCFYFSGDLNLLSKPGLSIIGSRKASSAGIKRARKLARLLVREGFVIYSGLAEGIDTAVHSAAIEEGGKTVAVIGTSITDTYPPFNAELQKQIAKEHLLVSQVPILYYLKHSWVTNRRFFPERNKTMSALSKATVIVKLKKNPVLSSRRGPRWNRTASFLSLTVASKGAFSGRKGF